MLLCIGMQLASLKTLTFEYEKEGFKAGVEEWQKGEKYDINTDYFAVLASEFCSSSVFLAGHLLLQHNRRRRRLIVVVLAVVGVLQVITLVLYPTANSNSELQQLSLPFRLQELAANQRLET